MDEATAFLSTLQSTVPTAPTACTGWTAHELVAHLTAGAAEMAALTESVTSGRGGRATTDFAAREAPYVAMHDDDLRGQLVLEAIRLSTAIEVLEATGQTVPFAGRRLDSKSLTMHGRSEAALHRWDLAGDDDVSQELLRQPELTMHAVEVLNTMLEASPEAVRVRATAAGITDFRAHFGAPGQPDVVLVVDGAGARLKLDEPRAHCCAAADPATRLLALWGRRSPTRLITWDADEAAAGDALATFLWGVEPGSRPMGPPARPTALSETR
jgi:hypothetical protein